MVYYVIMFCNIVCVNKIMKYYYIISFRGFYSGIVLVCIVIFLFVLFLLIKQVDVVFLDGKLKDCLLCLVIKDGELKLCVEDVDDMRYNISCSYQYFQYIVLIFYF